MFFLKSLASSKNCKDKFSNKYQRLNAKLNWYCFIFFLLSCFKFSHWCFDKVLIYGTKVNVYQNSSWYEKILTEKFLSFLNTFFWLLYLSFLVYIPTNLSSIRKMYGKLRQFSWKYYSGKMQSSATNVKFFLSYISIFILNTTLICEVWNFKLLPKSSKWHKKMKIGYCF